mgnify:FL=1|jgi:hypothetical protein|tara:strand:+ start:1033 stop:1359 length:327 start_codon:yes stop_codon:yes gene_type:complete
MGKILAGRLPQAVTSTVEAPTFNRAMRLLELNVGNFDPDRTPQYTSAERDTLSFEKGDVIWNTTENVLQVYLGNSWQNISTPSTSGVSATGSIGTVSVATNGNVVVSL